MARLKIRVKYVLNVNGKVHEFFNKIAMNMFAKEIGLSQFEYETIELMK